MSNPRPWLKFSLALGAAALWFALLAFRLPLGPQSPPPLGAFLNPYQGFYRNNAVDYWDDDAQLAGLRAPVEVYYDERLVPHVYASSAADLYFAQGYLQAQHRLFQLDLTARSAEGRLSEVLGERTLAFDRTRRRIGVERLADQIDSLWRLHPDTYAVVERYAEGVNAYVANLAPHEYPVEYKLLDFAPEAWSPRRTALVAISMAFTLNAANDDIPATATRELLGRQPFDFLFPERAPQVPPVIPTGTPFWGQDSTRGGLPPPAPPRADSSIGQPVPPTDGVPGQDRGVGSNNWVLAGEKTASGSPLLANDPHLALTLPSIWFESELHAGELSVHGVNLPGVPGVTIGFNEHVAWGVTNVGMDVLDWHAVDAAEPRTARVSEILVRGEDTVRDTVYDTRFGPLVYEAPDPRGGLAMSWLTLQRPSVGTFETFLELNRASGLEDYLTATARYEWPAQNFAFASRDGDIALRVSGLRPRRARGEGRFVDPVGGEALTRGYLPTEAAPLAINPDQHYLTSTNQVSTDATYPFYYSGYFDATRARRINALLPALNAAAPQDMMRLQQDDYYVLAADLTPLLLGMVRRGDLDLAARGQLSLLEAWDYRYGPDAVAPVVFEEWLTELAAGTWDELAGEGAQGPLYLRPEPWRLVELLRTDPLSPWFDVQSTPVRESAVDVVTAALVRAGARVDSITTGEPGYAWAEHNGPSVEHLARIDAFSRRGLHKGGRAGTLDAQRAGGGPSWRMIVSLGERPSAQVVYPGGQSGRPGHPHYDDMVDAWAAGRYFEVGLRRDAPAAAQAGLTRVVLRP